MDLCKLYNYYGSCLLHYLTAYLESESRYPIPEFSSSHCSKNNSNIKR